MKKRSLNSLKLNKQSIAAFADELNGGYASSGLNMSCPNICKMTNEDRLLCNDLDLPAPVNPTPIDSPAPSDAAANAPMDSPAG
ncbi:hypothetical protein H2O64_22540 [Kordia sp. YSTF-M3]|uniref:Natural product n=1 Tax=Kordia aestuariivivens TaxID=2759037 RepID=A0ABR7QFY9_9FLAO|nr:hypothetical protein [Kordia aestuariivivens]MBC8757466.1 hypothetical protein [Kordia aestuariivivens]